MKTFTEKSTIEDYILEKLQDKGWKFVPADNLERNSYREPLLIPNLVRALKRINAAISVTDEEINKILNELMLAGTGIEGSKQVLSFYKFGIPVKFEKERIVKYVQLFDFSETDKNEFIVTRQTYYDGKEKIRTDLILYVNGIPLVDIECKSPVSLSENWFVAYKQIKDYEKLVPELYKYVQVGVAAESFARYFPIVPWQDEVETDEWRDGDLDSIDSTIEMLSRETLLELIQNFIFFRIERGKATKVLTRYMQYRAANKVADRVIRCLRGEETKNKGLIWHWQGSGKTLTMIFAANKLYYSKSLENPTVFFIVDRVELEEQLNTEFAALDMMKPEVIGSVRELKETLEADDYRGKRGVFIMLVHKFRPEELDGLQNEIEKVSRFKETIMNRKNVIAFVDEGHRTQYGILAAQMKAMLKSAFFFALSGTPISKRGRDTYTEFSYPPEERYLDRYFVTDSLKDNFTVKIAYRPRLEREVQLKKDMLDAFLDAELEELPEETRDDIEEKVKKRLSTIKLFLENPQRIKVISEDIASHFKENIDGKFKGMVVAGSRKGCVLYKQELAKLLPREYSEIVMSLGAKEEDPLLAGAVAEAKARYGDKDMDDIRKDIIEKFKEEELPKILIVTEMLLTGFDAPILQVMYLDKPLKEHRLLQAVARTNRPFKGLKGAGLVLDYVGILKEYKKALEMYSKEDVDGVLVSYDTMAKEFALLVEEILELLKDVARGYERDTLLTAVEVLTSDEEVTKGFVEKYKKMRKVFEILGPSEIKLEYLEDFKWISAIYTYYMKVVIQRPAYEADVQKYYDKTIRFIHSATEIDELEKELPAIEFDEKYLENLEKRVKSRNEKAASILFTLNRLVLVERHGNPIYESLTEKVERLLELWKEKTKDFKRIYSEGAEILKNINTLTARQKALGLTDVQYAMLLELERMLGEIGDPIEEVKRLSLKLEKLMFSGWQNQTTAKKDVEREIRKFVRGVKAKHRLSLDDMNALHESLMESVENYGVA